MTVSALSPTANLNSSPAQTKRKTTLNQEDFLNLFVTQMRYQNPLDPMDNYQMATQMAQLNSVEALNKMNSSLQNIGNYQASMNSLQATGLIGKKVETLSNLISIDGGKVSEGYYELSRPGRAVIRIYDAGGSLVRIVEEGIKDHSKQKVVWDGKNQQGTPLPDGAYTFQVSAIDEKGQSIPVQSYGVDIVTGISFENGVIYLQGRSKKITLGEILSIQS